MQCARAIGCINLHRKLAEIKTLTLLENDFASFTIKPHTMKSVTIKPCSLIAQGGKIHSLRRAFVSEVGTSIAGHEMGGESTMQQVLAMHNEMELKSTVLRPMLH